MKFAALPAALLLFNLASADELPETYDMRSLDSAQVLEQMKACVGTDQDSAALERFAADRRSSDQKEDEWVATTGRAAVLATNDQWACVHLTGEGHPLWPIETLKGAVVTPEATAQEVNEWRRQMLDQVAQSGAGWGLIVVPGGSAYRIDVTSEAGHPLRARYTQHFFKPGEIDIKSAPAVLAPGRLKNIMFTSPPGDKGWFAIPVSRLHPVVDGYVTISGNAATNDAACAGTAWAFSNKAVLALQQDHVMTMTPEKGGPVTTGSWAVQDGVLHVAFGVVRFSFVIDGKGRLVGTGRRPPAFEGDDSDFQNRWDVVLTAVPKS
jgi:hypothetical protein